jgi:hypothetical protein
MNKKHITFVMAVLLAAAVLAVAQDAKTDRVVVPLSNPGKPATVKVSLMTGSIKVIGYEGKEVIVEATPRERMLGEESRLERPVRTPVPPSPPAPAIAADAPRAVIAPAPVREAVPVKEQEKSKKDKTAGMKKIPIEGTGLTVEENDNVVRVEIESMRRAVDVVLRVPFSSSLKLEGTNLAETGITVENISGEIEVESANGGIILKNVSGSVVANTTNGDIEVTLAKVMPDKPMSFVTFNGDVDVTLPPDTKANLKIKSNMGEIYSDFDVTLKSVPVKTSESGNKEGGKFRISLDRAVMGAINGGGAEFTFENFNGNIYIRKKK